MSNIVEFVLRVRDLMSSGVAAAARNAVSHLNEVDRAVERIPQSMGRQSGRMGQAGTSLGKMFKANFLANIGSDIVSGLTNMLKSAGSAIVGGLFTKQKDIAGLETFLGAQGAADLYKQIQQDAAATPFGTEGLLQVNKALVSAGLGAKQARQDTLALANAISAVGGGNAELARMAANMQQIKTVGEATSVDIKQFGMAGINIYKILSDATGKSIDQVKEMTVSYDLLSMALQKASAEGGIYYGAMDRYSKKLPGMWDAFTEGLATSATEIGSRLEPAIGGIIGYMSGMAGKIPALLDRMSPVFDFINNSVMSILDGINSLTSGTSAWGDYFGMIADHLSGFVDLFLHIGKIAGGIIMDVVNWVRQSWILKDLMYLIKSIASSVWSVISWIADKIKWLWDNVIYPIIKGIENVYRWIRGGESMGAEAARMQQQQKDTAAKTEPEGPAAPAAQPVVSSGGVSTSGLSSKPVTQAGPKIITVNINKEMIGSLSINSMNIREGVGEMENMIKEMLYRLLLSLETAN